MPQIMFSSIVWCLMCLFISLFIWLVTFLFIKDDISTVANVPFECGLETIYMGRSPFRMHFFLIGILFLVFDMEFIISLPLVIVSMDLLLWLIFWVFFMSLLLMGLLLEIMMGTLDWKE